MKSRSRSLILAAVAIVLLWALWPRRPQPKRILEHISEVSNQAAPPVSAPTEMPLAPSNQPGEALRRRTEDTPERKDKTRRFLESKNVPIDFYGQTLDQDGNVLGGVQISAMVRHSGVETLGTGIRIVRTTDESGRFDIHDVTGDAFSFESIVKQGYELEPCQLSFGPSAGSLTDPVLFKLWQTNIHEALIVGERAFPITPNGQPCLIDLNKGVIVESGSGDLSVSVHYEAHPVRGQVYDWSSEIDSVNGGLLEESNNYSAMYVAPTNGYTQQFRFDQQIKGGQRGSIGTRRFYVTLRNGKEFGRMTVGIFAPYNQQVPGLIRMEYAINPAGSPILR